MKSKIIIPIVIGVAASLFLVLYFQLLDFQPQKSENYENFEISYLDSNSNLKTTLQSQGISMSSPLTFKGASIKEYCNFFEDEIKQNSVDLCTSTQLIGSDGNFLGNIHFVGTSTAPNTVLAIIQTDPFMSNLDSIKTIYQTAIKSLVCDCWNQESPGGIDSISEWIDMAKFHHLEAKRTTSKSVVEGLSDSHLFLEITTNQDGYLWKLVITKSKI